jgi:hypothetical protein
MPTCGTGKCSSSHRTASAWSRTTGAVTGTSQPNNNSTGSENTQPTEAATASVSHQLSAADIETSFDGVFRRNSPAKTSPAPPWPSSKMESCYSRKAKATRRLRKEHQSLSKKLCFVTGSVSKLFTWAALMQLCGHWKLDLDRSQRLPRLDLGKIQIMLIWILQRVTKPYLPTFQRSKQATIRLGANTYSPHLPLMLIGRSIGPQRLQFGVQLGLCANKTGRSRCALNTDWKLGGAAHLY